MRVQGRRGQRPGAAAAGIALLALALAAPAFAERAGPVEPARVGLSAARLDRIRQVLRGHVDAGRLAGAVALLARRGEVAFLESFGTRDRASGAPMTDDTLFRIASMSKPVTSVAVMMLHEEGRLLLDDPVSRYLPQLGGLEVWVDGPNGEGGHTVPAARDMTIQDLLRHTSGLSYGFFGDSEVDRRYLAAGVYSEDATLAETVEKLGKIPLKHQPGSVWEYSLSTDVLARLVEVVSGVRFDRFLRERLFEPLGMVDTGFEIDAGELDRLATLYTPTGDGTIRASDPNPFESYDRPRTYFSGGGGLVSTAGDYLRFCQMLLDGGVGGGVRVLGRKTVELMRSDHLGAIPMPGRPGYGFGLGFGVRLAPGVVPSPGSVGEYYWGGAYGTRFWIDPEEELVGVFLIQLRPGERFGSEFEALAYQAIAD